MSLFDILNDAANQAQRQVLQARYTVPTSNGPGLHTKPATSVGPGLNSGYASGTTAVPKGSAPGAMKFPAYAPSEQQTAQDIYNWMSSRPVSEVASPAPAPTTAAPVAAAPAAPAAPAANQYPWLDSAFGKYFQAIQQDFADRGLLDSTNKLQPMSELADAYSQRYAQEARTDNQNAVTNAINLWSTLSSGQLQLADLARLMGLDANMNLPAQPSIFSSVFNQSYLPPTKGTGQVGDAPVVTRAPGIDTTRGDVVPTYGLGMKNVAYQDEQKNLAANRAIQNAYLKLAQDEAGKADGDTAKWEQMAADIVQNKLAGKAAPGSNLFPSDMLESFQAAYGIDIVGLVKAGDPRAIALVRSAYDDPETADAVIARMQGGSVPQARRSNGGGFDKYPNTNMGSIMESGDKAVSGYLSQPASTQAIQSGVFSKAFPGIVPNTVNTAFNLKSLYDWLQSPSK